MCNGLRRSAARQLHHGLHGARAITSRLLQRPQRNRAGHGRSRSGAEAVSEAQQQRLLNQPGPGRAGGGVAGGGQAVARRGEWGGQGGGGGGGRGGGGRRGRAPRGRRPRPRPWPPDGARAGGASPAVSEPPPAPRPPLPSWAQRERERVCVTPFQPHRADAGAAKPSPGRSQ